MSPLEQNIVDSLCLQIDMARLRKDATEAARYMRLLEEYKSSLGWHEQPTINLCECSDKMPIEDLMAVANELIKICVQRDPHSTMHALVKIGEKVGADAVAAFSASSGSEGGPKLN